MHGHALRFRRMSSPELLRYVAEATGDSASWRIPSAGPGGPVGPKPPVSDPPTRAIWRRRASGKLSRVPSGVKGASPRSGWRGRGLRGTGLVGALGWRRFAGRVDVRPTEAPLHAEVTPRDVVVER